MRLSRKQRLQILATLEEMRDQVELDGVRTQMQQEELDQIDRRISRLKKSLEDEMSLLRETYGD